ncbi:aldehyde dehydrogenase [Chryseomicrobium sp. FSL W7-1435]|uniref:aldehyde dehydrogenase n=1 Tax=Chryseomicrobium sp. FSL W7-1435 TaxID=2921704 RepID=UPI00315A57AF
MNFTEQQVESWIKEQQYKVYAGETKSLEFRLEQLELLRQAIKKFEPEILEALHQDLRKSEFEAFTTEIGIIYESISYMKKNLADWMKPQSVKTPTVLQPAKSYLIHEPYGSCLIIAPFNYPFQLVMEPLIGAIVGGNAAVVKPSEATPHVTKVVRTLIEDTFSADYIRVVEGEKEETSTLIHAPFDLIFFTGSVQVGKVVMKAAAERLTPVVLELGGKSPAIIDHTANLDVAAKRIVWGKFMNSGQTCVAPDYLVVHESVKEPFIAKLKETIATFYGEDAQTSPDFSRIVNHKQFDRLHDLLTKSEDSLVHGGQTDREDLYIEPSLFEVENFDHPLMEDELFGPLLPILTYTDLSRAIYDIRKLPKPLAAYFFSEHERAQDYFVESFPFGGGCINDTISHVGSVSLPFGGVGTSGMGSYHGRASFDQFTHQKSILKKSTKLPINLLYPPYKSKVKLVRSVLK